MQNWKKTSLADCCDKITSGGTPARSNTGFYTNGTIPWIKTGELHDCKVFGNNVSEWITEEALNNSSAKLFPENTILMAMYGDGKTIGSLGIIQQPSASNQACSALIANSEVCLPKFLFYALKVWRDGLIRLAYGGAQRNLTSKLIQQYKILIPNLDIQQKIAAILSTYDDLIENNLKRIKLLEEMAQITYEEWFVRLKFPGHETTPLDSATGLPVGWGFGTLADLVSFLSGYAYKTEQFTSTGFPVMKIKNISGSSVDIDNSDCIDDKSANETPRFKLAEGDLLIAMTGATVGKVGILPFSNVSCYLNQRVGKFIPKQSVNNTGLVYCILSSENGYQQILNFASGAAQPNISGSQILSVKTVVPPIKIQSKFSELINSIIQHSLNLRHQNQLLKEARDILLPRLMTGMIDVEQLALPESLGSNPTKESQAA